MRSPTTPSFYFDVHRPPPPDKSSSPSLPLQVQRSQRRRRMRRRRRRRRRREAQGCSISWEQKRRKNCQILVKKRFLHSTSDISLRTKVLFSTSYCPPFLDCVTTNLAPKAPPISLLPPSASFFILLHTIPSCQRHAFSSISRSPPLQQKRSLQGPFPPPPPPSYFISLR